jgi:hypothetical protein
MKRTALLLMLLTFLAVVPVPTVAATTTPSNGRIVFSRFDPEADDSRLGVNAEPIASRASHRNGGAGQTGGGEELSARRSRSPRGRQARPEPTVWPGSTGRESPIRTTLPCMPAASVSGGTASGGLHRSVT